MAMPLSIAKSLRRTKGKGSKPISEYAGKASPVSKKTRSGATDRRKKKSGR